MSVTSAAVAAGRSAAGSSNTAGSSSIPGFGSPFGRATGNRGGLMGMTQKLMERVRAKALARKGGAVGNASAAVGGNDGRFTSIESRLEALEGGGGSGDVVAQGTGGAVKQDMAGVESGSMPEAPLPAGSLSEAMPSPAGASMDIFGSEFARNSAVGAAKMRINKKI